MTRKAAIAATPASAAAHGAARGPTRLATLRARDGVRAGPAALAGCGVPRPRPTELEVGVLRTQSITRAAAVADKGSAACGALRICDVTRAAARKLL